MKRWNACFRFHPLPVSKYSNSYKRKLFMCIYSLVYRLHINKLTWLVVTAVAGYRAPSRHASSVLGGTTLIGSLHRHLPLPIGRFRSLCTSYMYFSSSSVVPYRALFLRCAMRAMRVFDLRASFSPLDYVPLCQISFLSHPPLLS